MDAGEIVVVFLIEKVQDVETSLIFSPAKLACSSQTEEQSESYKAEPGGINYSSRKLGKILKRTI